jgi:nitrogen fixation protein FixH
MKKSFVLSLVVASAVSLMGCGGSKEKEKEEPANAVEALQQFTDKAKEMGDKKAVDPVDFRSLKALLPETTSGLKRTESTGEKTGAMGFTISMAKASYSEGDASMSVEIMDTGGIAGMASMAMAAWAMADIDKETENGYEKTTKIDGHKAFEKYDNQRKSGEINVLVGNRYIINVHGNGVSVDQMKDVLGDINLNKLEALK